MGKIGDKYAVPETGYSILTKADLEKLHETTLDFMADYGVTVYGKDAQEYLSAAGCDVDNKTNMVKFPKSLVNDCIESAPSEYTLYPRGANNKEITVANGKTVFSNFSTGTMVRDLETGERQDATYDHICRLTRLMDGIDEVEYITTPVIATDVRQEIKELYEAKALFSNTSKHVGHDADGRENTRNVIRIAAAIAGGMEQLRERPILSLGSCPTSPLALSENACGQIIEATSSGVPIDSLSMGLCGGTTPVTLAGTLLSTNCEILAGIILGQTVSKGAKMMYGSCSTIMDLAKATSPIGAPEHAMLGAAVAQIGSFYGIPTEVGGTLADSKVLDIQNGHEKTFTAMLPSLAGSGIVFGMGMIESGMTMSYEQLIIDAEIVRMVRRALQGITVDDIHLAADVLKEVGPEGTFLSSKHTRKFMRQESSNTRLFDRSVYEIWEKEGAKAIQDIAKERAKDILENHQPEPLPADVLAEIDDIIGEAEERLGS